VAGTASPNYGGILGIKGNAGQANGSGLYNFGASLSLHDSFHLAAPAASTAGSAFTVTVTALDADGNTATGYTGTVHFTSTDGQASLPADYSFTGSDEGAHSFSGVVLKTAGSQALTATDTTAGSITGAAGVTVSPAAASSFSLTAPAGSTAGSAFSVTVTALDPYGNTATGYTAGVHFTSSDGQATLPTDYTFQASDAGQHTLAGGVTLFTAGNQTLSASASGVAAGTASVAVSPASAASLSLAAPTSATAGSSFAATVTVRDAYGNTATGYTGTVHFASTDAQSTLPADYTFTADDQGTHTFAAALKTAGTQSLTATDTSTTSVTGTESGISVSPAAASQFRVTAPAGSTAGSAFSVTVTALDAYGNTASGYRGTAHFTSSDGQVVLPADYPFTASDAGAHAFSVTLETARGTPALTPSPSPSTPPARRR
jgi:hypothetical protein